MFHQFHFIPGGGGLICAISDQSGGARWGCSGTEITGADGLGIGTGEQNTIDIEAGCTTSGIAADICANLTLNGYSDWFLPSFYELYEMYLKSAAIDATAIARGGSAFSMGLPYHSSSEYSSDRSWFVWFNGGYTSYGPKNNNYRVRAVRSF